jgi:hypothetical protein
VRPEGLGKFKNSSHRESNPRPSGLYILYIYIYKALQQISAKQNETPRHQGNNSIGDFIFQVLERGWWM